MAAVKGQVGAARAAISPQAETHLRNAQEELREEHVEIALYTRIETFAVEVGDKDTAQLAKSIRRDEERMAKFLDAELVRLVKEVVRAEIPRDQRTTPRRRSTRRRTTTRAASARSRTATGVVRTGTRSTAARKTTASGRKTTAAPAQPAPRHLAVRARATAPPPRGGRRLAPAPPRALSAARQRRILATA